MSFKKLLLSGALAAGLVACGDQSSDQASAPSAQQAATTAGLLARVPAETPYLFLNTKPVSDQLYDHYIDQYASTLDSMALMLDDIELEEDNPEAQSALNSLGRFYRLLAELDSSSDIREKTGINANGMGMLYGAGVFPVVVMEIADQAKASATLTELMQDDQGNDNSQSVSVDGVSISKKTFADDHVAVYWQITEQHMTLSILPVQMEADYLSQIFGDARPANAFSMNQVNDMNSRYGFSGYGSGFFDLVGLYDQLVSGDTPEGASLAALLEDDQQSFLNEPACVAEVRTLLSKAPRLYSGLTSLSTEQMSMRSVVDMDSNLRAGLTNVVGNAPIGVDPGTPLNFALNLNLAGLRDFLAEQTSNVLQTPYTCSHLAGLNDAAQQINTGVNQPMLPLLGTINGLQISLTNLNLDQLDQQELADMSEMEDIARQTQGHMVLYTEQPNMLIGLGQMALPFLAGLDLQPGGEPQLLESDFIPAGYGPAYIASSDSAIGVAIGEQQQDSLSQLLNADGNDQPVLFSFGMDYQLYSQFLGYVQALEEVNDDGEADSPEDEKFKALMQQMYQNYANLGYSYSSVLVNEQGLVMDQVIYMND